MGAATVAIGVGVVAVAALMFQGKFETTAALTVVSQRAGLVMNPDAKVQLLGVDVGRVESIDVRPDGQAVLKLAMHPDVLKQIPTNVGVDISSTTVFGAKYVQLVPPPNPSSQSLSPGAVLAGDHVTIEVNTVFERLNRVLAKVDPPKLNETLGALAATFDGRGERAGQTLSDLNRFLGALEPSLDDLDRDLREAPGVLTSYADAAENLVTTADNATHLGDTIVDRQQDLDALLLSTIGLASAGDEFLSANGEPLANLQRLLVPTTTLTNEYNPALTCALQGLAHIQQSSPPLELPGVVDSVGLTLARERYRYPDDLPKVAASGGPHCADMLMPAVPANTTPPYLVVNDGADPTRYGNQGILLNSDGLKQMLFGPIAGPPRNSAQIGQPG
nr:MCE family protein [Mycobacterium sp. DL440]